LQELNSFLPVFAVGLATGLVAGAASGVIGGLAGLGGGLIYMPVFYAMMPPVGMDVPATVMASLVAVAMTAAFSVRSHLRLGHVHLETVRQLGPGLMVGAVLGLWLTLRVPEAAVLAGLAVLDAWIAWDCGRAVRSGGSHVYPVISSGPIGYVSGMLGIGGGTMLVPILRRLLPLRRAVGTASLCSLLMAAAAVLVNLLFESGWRILLGSRMPYLAGVWTGILVALPFSTGWAARLHATIPEERMRAFLRGVFAMLSLGLFLAALWAGEH